MRNELIMIKRKHDHDLIKDDELTGDLLEHVVNVIIDLTEPEPLPIEITPKTTPETISGTTTGRVSAIKTSSLRFSRNNPLKIRNL